MCVWCGEPATDHDPGMTPGRADWCATCFPWRRQLGREGGELGE